MYRPYYSRVAAIALLGLWTLSARPALGFIDSINPSAVPAPEVFFDGIPGIGWYYTPSFSYYLTGVNSYFDPLFTGPTSLVTVQIQTERPVNGGVVLGQGVFTVNTAGGDLGASFAPVPLNAGQTYFVDYENVDGVGVNLGTWQNDNNGNPQPSGGAVTNLGTWYVDNSNGFAGVQTNAYSFAKDNQHVSGSEPILRFEGFITPEPSELTIALSGCGILVLYVVFRDAWRRSAKRSNDCL